MTTMQAQILDYIVRHEYVSYAELERIEGFAGGDRAIVSTDHPNIVCWTGLTEEAKDAVLHLLNTGQIHHKPASILVYCYDGRAPNLPLVKSARRYKTPHWLPVTLNSGPHPEPRQQRRARS